MATRKSDLPPAVAEWQANEQRWSEEAREWVRNAVGQYLSEDKPQTCAEIITHLDGDPTMPTGYARLRVSETGAYNRRYHLVRNILEKLARERKVNLGTTINVKGRERSTTYSLPRNIDRVWNVQVAGAKPAVQEDIEAELRAFLTSLAEKGYSPKEIGRLMVEPAKGDDRRDQEVPKARPRKQRRPGGE